MDFNKAEGNKQPLMEERNTRPVKSYHKTLFDIQVHRKDGVVVEIGNYNEDDPLETWLEYILWIEENYPSGGKESGFEEVLNTCLVVFGDDERYFQDRRMIKLHIKYIDTLSYPTEFYKDLHNLGIGTMVADLYICWAYYYDLLGLFKIAKRIYQKGFDARAQPFEELDQAYKHFCFDWSQRILYQDQDEQKFISSLQERRNALKSLQIYRKQDEGIRIETAVQNVHPDTILINETNSTIKVPVFEDQNCDPNLITIISKEENVEKPQILTSVVSNIIDSDTWPRPSIKAKITKRRKNNCLDAVLCCSRNK